MLLRGKTESHLAIVFHQHFENRLGFVQIYNRQLARDSGAAHLGEGELARAENLKGQGGGGMRPNKT